MKLLFENQRSVTSGNFVLTREVDQIMSYVDFSLFWAWGEEEFIPPSSLFSTLTKGAVVQKPD